MALEVRQNEALSVSVTPSEVWNTPVAAVLSPAGATLDNPSVTADSVSTTVASAANGFELVLASVSGVVAGVSYLVTHDGVGAVVTVARVDAATKTVTLVDPLPWTPDAADPFVGLQLTCEVGAAYTATRDVHYSVEFTDSVVAGREERETFHVVRRRFLPPLSAGDVNAILARQWPSEVLAWEEMQDIADEVHDEIRDELLGTGEYAHIYLDPTPFRAAAKVIARRMLATNRGLYPPAQDADEYIRRLERERERLLGRVIASLQPRDADDDGSADDDDEGYLSAELTR